MDSLDVIEVSVVWDGVISVRGLVNDVDMSTTVVDIGDHVMTTIVAINDDDY